MEIEVDLCPFFLDLYEKRTELLKMFVFIEGLLIKSKSFCGKREIWISVCIKESRFDKLPIVSVLLCSLLVANCLFRSRIQRLYRNIVECIRFENVHWCEKGCFEKKADVCVSGFRLLNLIFEYSQKILLFDEFTSSAVVSTYCSVAEIRLF